MVLNDMHFDAIDTILTPDARGKLDLAAYRHDSYERAIGEVDHLTSEDDLERQMRISSYLHLTRFLRYLLDRKDRMSMAVGLEVRVPYCDHRLVDYVYNVPWALKTYDGREKSLLRGAARDVLPDTVLERVKTPYPSTRDWRYARDLQEQARELLAQPADRVFDLVDRTWLVAATGCDPAAISPTDRYGLEWTLNLAIWLDVYRPQLLL
jgi:asparagine synthase (glutamine-hydrolysing)